VVDQVVSGLSNVALAVAAARVGTPAQFGVLSASVVALTALLAVSRVGLGNSVTMAGRSGDEMVRTVAGRSMALLVCLAPLLMIFVLSVAWVAGASQAAPVAVLLAVAAPIILVQDLLRFQSSALRRTAWALTADLSWLLVMGLIIAWGILTGRGIGLVAVTAAWLAGAAVALALLAGVLGTSPMLRGLGAWAQSHGRFLVNSMGGTAAVSAANVGRVSLIGAAQGPVAVGSLSAGQLIMTPLNLLAALIPFAMTPVIARRSGSGSATRAYGLVAACTSVAGAAWWAACAAIPDTAGTALLGEMWAPAIALLAPMALLSIGVLLNAAAGSLLLFLGRSRAYAGVTLAMATLSLVGTVLTLNLGGGVSALAWTQTGVVLTTACVGWALALTRHGSREAGQSGSSHASA
jgi:O-antigen/teichoic acid export membrane protein